MPTRPLTDQVLRETLETYQRLGSYQATADALGLGRNTVKHRLELAAERGIHLDDGITQAMAATGLHSPPQLAWIKTKPKDGEPGYSVLVKPPAFTDNFLDRVRDAFEGMEAAPHVTPPENVMDEICNVFPLFDVHWGLHAWGDETGGQSYDLKLAARDMVDAFESVLKVVPFGKQAILIIGGDFFHMDDSTNETPKSRHKLDVDGRFHKVIEEAIRTLSFIIQRIQSKHERLTIRVLRGNHDEHSSLVLTFALSERFRGDPHVEVDKSPRDLFMMQWGTTALFAHHGDRAPPERQALYLSDVCPFWSDTRHRYYYSGHIHKDQARDIGPLRWESLRAFAPPDSYAASMGYFGRRALRADTYHLEKGRIMTTIDPVARKPAT